MCVVSPLITAVPTGSPVGKIRTTALTVLVPLALFAACAGNPNSPTNLTQARIDSNNGWRLSGGGEQRAAGPGTYTFDLGPGEQCATVAMSITRTGPTGPYLDFAVGHATRRITTDTPTTLCGRGPVRE